MNAYKLDWPYLEYLAFECQGAYTEPADLKAGGVEVRVTEDDHENLVFAFRGTTFDGLDIIKDLRALPWYTETLRGWYHRGFLLGARAILPKILDELTKHDGEYGTGPPWVPYILTGHSKGGAEATIVAAMMTRLGRPPRALVTFGAPYAGSAGLMGWLRGVDGHRVVNHGDPVPHVPWLLNKVGVFEHHRGETQINTSLNGPWVRIENHKISRYIDALGYTPHG